jgi:RNA polymerase sigma-70 factor (ECF subfamily)
MYPLSVNDDHKVGEVRVLNADDENLVSSARDGSAPAFEALVTRHRRIVLAVMRRITGSFDDAEDLTQQAFMKAFMNLPRFRGQCRFSTWLVSIAVNEARMWNRRARRSREVPMVRVDSAEEVVVSLDFPDQGPDPEASYSEKERSRILSREIARLKPPTRAAIQICDLEENTVHSAAQVLGITESAIKSRRGRARAALRRRLKEQFVQYSGQPESVRANVA